MITKLEPMIYRESHPSPFQIPDKNYLDLYSVIYFEISEDLRQAHFNTITL